MINGMRGLYLIIYLFVLSEANAHTESSDTLKEVSLDSVVVNSNAIGDLRYNKSGAIHISMSTMNEMPKILGNADPIHYSQMLPGISTNGEYDAGIRVWGCETGHNYVSINNSPVYGVEHMMGLFSVMNASHYKSMYLQKSLASGGFPNCLGAVIDMQTDKEVKDSVSGCLDIGLISSQGTIRLPVGKKTCMTLSGRYSYLNLFYSSFLRNNEQETHYSFYDTNINITSHLDERNTLVIDTYMGGDDMKLLLDNSSMRMNMEWGSQMMAVHWENYGKKMIMDNSIFFSRYHNRDNVVYSSLQMLLPSSISELGYKFNARMSSLSFGGNGSLLWIEPQRSEVIWNSGANSGNKNVLNTKEISVYADYTLGISRDISFITGFRESAYFSNGKGYYRSSPSLSIIYDPNDWYDVLLCYSHRNQFLHQTGISSLNTPLEYWTTCGVSGIEPQSSDAISLKLRLRILDNRYSLAIEGYSKWLGQQLEYNGTIYSFLSSESDNAILYSIGRGRNYGVNVTLSKNVGRLRGWIGYAWSKGFRTFDTEYLAGTFPSSHNRDHELNVVATWRIGRKWDVGMTGVYASGTAFTAPKSYMILQNTLIPQFDSHNGKRLSPYYRIDASVNYKMPINRRLQGILNLSVYNLTGHANDLFYYMSIKKNMYQYKCMRFVFRVLPSISYSIRF